MPLSVHSGRWPPWVASDLHELSSLCLRRHMACFFVSLFSLYKDTSLWIWDPPDIQDEFISRPLPNYMCQDAFPIRTCTYIFVGK